MIYGNLISALGLPASHKERSAKLYRLAQGNGFTQGRKIEYVAAVCLYMACRQDKENAIMLIDISEMIKVNVFKLGRIYTDLCETISYRPEGNIMNAELLIARFARDLEFGEDQHRIAKEAVLILSRMKRDWLVYGRRPAGLCGAALILAARMNNYRRTVREVVYTAKIGDQTIQKRLDEFSNTEASTLTVAEFKHHGLSLEKEHDPPSFNPKPKGKSRMRDRDDSEDGDEYDGQEGDGNDEHRGLGTTSQKDDSVAPYDSPWKRNPRQKLSNPTRGEVIDWQHDIASKNRKRVQIDISDESDESSGVSESNMSDSATHASKRTKRGKLHSDKQRADSEAMPPPPIPIDPTLLALSNDQIGESSSQASSVEPEKRKRGRPLGSKNKSLPEPSEEDIRDEMGIEVEIDNLLENQEMLQNAERVHDEMGNDAPLRESAEPSIISNISSNPDIDPSEFDDDPEVATCLLTEAERDLKERIWVTENGDYLRKVQGRKIRKELAEKAGTTPVVQHRRRRRTRIGDLSAYKDADGNPIKWANADESSLSMLQYRGSGTVKQLSKKINYGMVPGEGLTGPVKAVDKKRMEDAKNRKSIEAQMHDANLANIRKAMENSTSSPSPSRTPTPGSSKLNPNFRAGSIISSGSSSPSRATSAVPSEALSTASRSRKRLSIADADAKLNERRAASRAASAALTTPSPSATPSASARKPKVSKTQSKSKSNGKGKEKAKDQGKGKGKEKAVEDEVEAPHEVGELESIAAEGMIDPEFDNDPYDNYDDDEDEDEDLYATGDDFGEEAQGDYDEGWEEL